MSFMARRVLPSIMKFMCNHATCYQFSERFLLNTASKSRVCVCGENKDAKAKWKQESLFFWHPSTAFMSYDRNSINGHKFNLLATSEQPCWCEVHCTRMKSSLQGALEAESADA